MVNQAVATLAAEDSAAASKIATNNKELARLSRSIHDVKTLLTDTAKELRQANERLLVEKSRLLAEKRAVRTRAEIAMKAQAAKLRALCLTRQGGALRILESSSALPLNKR